MAAENFKVKKGLEVGTGTTINATGINVTGVVTATQLVGDGSGLTGVVGSGSGVVIKDEGSAVGTAGTINFVGSGIAATLSEGTATVTVGINTANIVTDTLNVSGISTFDGRVLIGTTTEGHANADDLTIATSSDTGITIRSGTTNNGRIYFSDATSGAGEFVGSLDYDHNNDSFNIITDSELRLRIDSSGRLLLGTTTVGHPNADDLTIATDGDTGITIRSGTTNNGRIYFSDATSGTGQVVGSLDYDHNLDKFNIVTNGELRFHINGDGNVGINSGLTVSGISTFTNEIVIRDDSPTITFDQTSGNLNTNQYRIKQASGELVVQVSHNNGASYTNGVSIGGIGNIFIPDNDKVFFGTNDDAYIQHDNSNLNVINTTGNIDVTGNVVLNNDLKVGTGATLAPNGNANFSGIITATSFSGLLVGNVQGNATSASSCSGNAATATEATNVTVTANNSTDETVYPVFVDGATGKQGAETDTGLNYNPSTGNLSATKFTGDGSGLTSIPSAQLDGALPALDGSALTNIAGSGSGVIIRHDGNVVGTASSINFSTNLDVTPISAGIVTVTASGGSGGIVGIDTTATSVFNEIVVGSAVTVNSTGITATGVGITADTLRSNGQLIVGGAIYGTSRILLSGGDGGDTDYYSGGTSYSEHIFRLVQSGSSITRFRINRYGVDVSGIATATSFSGSGIGLTSLNADNLGSGTIPNGRFPATLPAASGANLTNLPAGNLTGTIDIARIADSAVTFAKMQDVGTGVLIGRNDSGSGVMETLTAAEVRTLINVEDGATAGGGGFSQDSQGNLVAGTNAGSSLDGSSAEYNILLGEGAGESIDGDDNNIAIGYDAGKNNTASSNIFIGKDAAKSLNSSLSSQNIFIGHEAVYNKASISGTVVGAQAGIGNGTGINLTLFGYRTGGNSYNSTTFIGHQAGRSATSDCDYTTAVGAYALYNNAGTGNVAIGNDSGQVLTSGQFNTLAGYKAGRGNLSGTINYTDCVAIGSSAAMNLSSANNVIVIGANANPSSNTATNEITLGNSSITKLRVPGIGLTFTSTTADSFSSDGQFVTSRWTVANNGSSNYTFTGPGGLSAASNSTLYLARGQTYEFNMNASGHGFGIQTSSGGWNASNEYTTGITNAKAAVGVIKFEVPFSAPNTLYYACTAGHGGMVGSLVIYPSI